MLMKIQIEEMLFCLKIKEEIFKLFRAIYKCIIMNNSKRIKIFGYCIDISTEYCTVFTHIYTYVVCTCIWRVDINLRNNNT